MTSRATVQARAESDDTQEQGGDSPQVTVVMETSSTDARGDDASVQPSDAAPSRTIVLAGEAMRRISEAAWAAEASEQALLASRDPLQDNPQAQKLEQELQQELQQELRQEQSIEAEASQKSQKSQTGPKSQSGEH